jgi:hypothetical protein
MESVKSAFIKQNGKQEGRDNNAYIQPAFLLATYKNLLNLEGQ